MAITVIPSFLSDIVSLLYVRLKQLHCSFRHNRHFLGCSWQQDCFARLYGNFILLIINNTARTLHTNKNNKRIQFRIVTSDFFRHVIDGSREIRACHHFYRFILHLLVLRTKIVLHICKINGINGLACMQFS